MKWICFEFFLKNVINRSKKFIRSKFVDRIVWSILFDHLVKFFDRIFWSICVIAGAWRLPRSITTLSIDSPFVFYFMRPDGRSSAAPVSSTAPKRKSFDRGGPVWPPRSNVANDRLRGGLGGLCPPQPKFGGSEGQRPPAKIRGEMDFFQMFLKKKSNKINFTSNFLGF